ncbi:MAG: hypothetical protein PHC92_02450 [Syntrophomonadaceae bacterium]|nr:hypothetical protein [Syntrophomonadaceae bacterium]MDD3022451.1 hypothetical protein [Syntrophomonadaceae bacterium]
MVIYPLYPHRPPSLAVLVDYFDEETVKQVINALRDSEAAMPLQ